MGRPTVPFHPILKTKDKVVLRESGRISYSCLKEILGFIALEQQLMLESQTGSLNFMADGSQKL